MNEHILQFFAYEHLRPELQAVSKPFGDLAQHIVATLPRNPERTVALRKLLESKDAALRALAATDDDSFKSAFKEARGTIPVGVIGQD